MQAKFDIITPLKQLQQDALSQLSPFNGQPSEFTRGYLLAIGHALEWAEIQQRRIQEAK